MKMLFKAMTLLMVVLVIMSACGGGTKSGEEKAESSELAPELKAIVEEVCDCYKLITEESGSIKFKTAVNSCVTEGMSKVSKIEGVSMKNLLDGLKSNCEEAHKAYKEI